MRSAALILMLCAAAAPSWTQRAIAARAGLIHYLEGRADIDGQRVVQVTNRFLRLTAGQTLVTGRRGRVEILLNPHTFLRLGENTTVRMLSDDLTDTRVELVEGRAILDVLMLENENAVTISVHGAEIDIRKDGLYQFENPQLLRVYDGEARIDQAKVTKGRWIDFGADTLEPSKFDRDETDDLYAWHRRRARAIERTNPSPFRRTFF